LGSKADHSLSSIAKINIEWRYISIPHTAPWLAQGQICLTLLLE
jgi:hypothetical protein